MEPTATISSISIQEAAAVLDTQLRQHGWLQATATDGEATIFVYISSHPKAGCIPTMFQGYKVTTRRAGRIRAIAEAHGAERQMRKDS